MPEAKKYTAEHIRDISEVIYRKRLGPDDVKRMIEKDADGGNKLRARASVYDWLVAEVLEALGV